ncbi:MAG: helix-turn-helix domain-containing protein [Corynebacterium sp.]|uniref:helix-turn-helix domain-containing protein n=1 Tax=Corynebacterium sp. TaxID=1720 RepID=UPI003F945FF8
MTVDNRRLPLYEAGELTFPVLAFGRDEVLERDTAWGEHSHPTHELLWNEVGSGMARVGQRIWTVAGGVGLWIPAGTRHSGYAPAGSRQRAVHFSLDAPALGEEPVAVEFTPLLGHLVDRLISADLPEESYLLTERMIFDVMGPSVRELVLDVPESELLRPIVDKVRSDPADQTTLTQWACRLGVSTKTVTRTFEGETGLGFSKWVATAKVKHAVALLGFDLEISDVAEQVGYRSVSAFITAFRRVTGMTPGQFRGQGTRMSEMHN